MDDRRRRLAQQHEAVEHLLEVLDRAEMELEHEAVLARDAVAFDDLGRLPRQLRDLVQLPAHRGPDADERGDRIADSPRVDVGVVAADHARLLEPLHALRDRWGRHAHTTAELGQRQARVLLELAQDAEVRPVQ
jgi:hypothetical protein